MKTTQEARDKARKMLRTQWAWDWTPNNRQFAEDLLDDADAAARTARKGGE